MTFDVEIGFGYNSFSDAQALTEAAARQPEVAWALVEPRCDPQSLRLGCELRLTIQWPSPAIPAAPRDCEYADSTLSPPHQYHGASL